jgi:threonine aldolase
MIDLFSDTLTQPTTAMRRAMADAPVADEQKREDPTTNRLQEMVAELLGKEAAVFMPSGSMCNAVGVKTHTQPSDAIFCDRLAHVYRSEFGGAALLSGVTTEPVDGDNGIFTAKQLEEALARFHPYGAVPRLVCVEQTHNFGGGTIWPLEQLREVCKLAHDRGLATHMDGARLMNACIATGIAAKDYAATLDSVWIDLSKGLGCPVGAVLAGSKDFIARAWRFKHLFGGAMRQSGILAAAGIYALENNVLRLREDHDNARLLAQGLASIKKIEVETTAPPTNIVFFNIAAGGISPADFHGRTQAAGVRFSGAGARIRAVTHLDISRQDVERAVGIVRDVVASGP